MTEKEFDDNLRYLEMADPENILLPTIREGYSKLNAIFLKQAVKNIPVVPIPEAAMVFDPEMIDIRITELFGQRAKLSNRFHELGTDKARAENSKEIQAIQRQISDLMIQKENGATEASDGIPTDPIQLMKFLNSTRAKISQAKKELERLGALPDENTDRTHIPLVEKRLQKLNLTKEDVVRRLQQKEALY